MAGERGWDVAPDAGRGWRRMVPSPHPQRILEVDHVRRLAEAGVLVIAGGGGGIPVAWRDGHLVGLDAVIDKDRCAAELAVSLGADMLVLVTGVPRVALGFGTPAARVALRLTVSDALRPPRRRRVPAREHGAEDRGRRALRGRRRDGGDHRRRAPGRRGRGHDGTWIVPDAEGPRSSARRRWRRELAGPHAARPLRRQRAADGHRAGAARARRRRACEVAMGTPANLEALAALGASADAGPGDVVIAVDGEDGLGDAVLAEVERAALRRRRRRGERRRRPRRRGRWPRSRAPTSRSSRCPASTRRSRRTAR